MLKRHLFIVVTVLMVNTGVIGAIFAQDLGWLVQKTAYLTVYYKPEVNLNRILGRLSKRFFYNKHDVEPLTSGVAESKMAYRLDLLFSRTQEVLDMYPPADGLSLKIFKNRRDLEAEYFNLFKKPGNNKSFYIHRHKTIYTSEQDISDSIISHEMAHAIVDHYFGSIPPGRIAELIAQYADLHLEE